MEEPREISQEPLGQSASKLVPDSATDFGNESFDYTTIPQKRFSLGGFNDWLFSLMRPKRKPVTQKQLVRPRLPNIPSTKEYMGPPFHPDNRPTVYNPQNNLNEPVEVPAGYHVENGLLLQKKTLAETVRDQIKNRLAFSASHTFIQGLALAVFLVGVFSIYSEIPTHPMLVLGIVLVTVGGNVLISRG